MDGIPGIEFNPDAGTQHLIDLSGWQIWTCPSGQKRWEHDNAALTELDTIGPMSPVERTIVHVRSSSSECSGTLVSPDVVLTAAHCVTDLANGDPLPAATITVCTMENLDVNTADDALAGCYEAVNVTRPSAWSGNNPYLLHEDWALVWLEEAPTVGSEPGFLPLTTRTNVEVESLLDHHKGYPQVDGGGCTLNSESDDCLTVDNLARGHDMWGPAFGTVVAPTAPTFMKWHTSTATGMSGGPHYLCPGGANDCADAEITGVQAGMQNLCGGAPACATGEAVGPKASAISAAVLTDLGSYPHAPPTCPVLGLDEASFVANAPAAPTPIDPAVFSPTCDPTATPLKPGFGTSICKDIQVYRPPQALGSCTVQDKLVVYLPGTGWGPEDNDFPMEYAAYAGYRTIGLSYANHWDTSSWCQERWELTLDPSTIVCHDENGTDSVLDYRDECAYWMRKERIIGVDDPRSGYNSALPFATPDQEEGFAYLAGYDATTGVSAGFPMEDSVLYRLLYTLIRLRQADAGDACDWDSFFDPTGLDGQITWSGSGSNLIITGLDGQMDVINWDKIIVAGWSQGNGTAAWINLHNRVGGLFMLDGPSDMCLTDGTKADSGRGASYYAELVDGVLEPSGAEPRFGAYHEQSPAPDGANPYPTFVDRARPVAWDNQFPDHTNFPLSGLNMPVCEDQPWDLVVAEAEPPGGPDGIPRLKRSHYREIGTGAFYTVMSLRTQQADGGLTCGPHESVALSHRPGSGVTTPNCMPDASGGQALSPDAASLFEAYVQGFCALGAP